MPGLAHFLVHTNVGNAASLALAAGVGAVAAFVVGLPLMRLSGLAAGIAHRLPFCLASRGRVVGRPVGCKPRGAS